MARTTIKMGPLVLAALLFGCSSGGDPGSGGGPPSQVSFALDVLPIFVAECITCHGGAGGLELDSHAGVLQGGDSGPVVVPFQPQNSLLIDRLDGTIPPQMPLNDIPLPQPEIDRIAQWIAEGAEDN